LEGRPIPGNHMAALLGGIDDTSARAKIIAFIDDDKALILLT
jgi:hypothetical protein